MRRFPERCSLILSFLVIGGQACAQTSASNRTSLDFTLRTEVEINATAKEVWPYIADMMTPSVWQKTMPNLRVVKTEQVTGRPYVVGNVVRLTKHHVDDPSAPPYILYLKLLDITPMKRVVFKGYPEGKSSTAIVDIELIETSKGTTRFVYDLTSLSEVPAKSDEELAKLREQNYRSSKKLLHEDFAPYLKKAVETGMLR